jgi:hypothetical protein
MSKRLVGSVVAASLYAIAPTAGAQFAQVFCPFMWLSTERTEIAAANKSLAADRELTSRVQRALSKDTEVQALGLAVNTMDGYVGLSGIAQHHAQAARAVAITRATLGVKDVIDEIRVH